MKFEFSTLMEDGSLKKRVVYTVFVMLPGGTTGYRLESPPGEGEMHSTDHGTLIFGKDGKPVIVNW